MLTTESIVTKWVYDFAEDSRESRELLGGKGAGIVSDPELVRGTARTGLDGTAGELALAPGVTVKASTPPRDAGELMVSHGVSHQVVVASESARPIGTTHPSTSPRRSPGAVSEE